MDWQTWHADYDRPGSPLAQRLQVVQDRIRQALDTAPPGPLTIISLCAGQGRDLLPVLAHHPRRVDVRARLVELDPANGDAARAFGLPEVEVVTADAALTDHYLDLAPAGLVLLCGIFGNITDADVERTVVYATRLTATGGTVIWTRHRRSPDLVPSIRSWFEEQGFEEQWMSPPDAPYGVGAHRFTGTPRPLAAGERMFAFV
ncbi:MAG: SAM-dependent methyltransferase [Thermoactinospora sp.]|nr:SAM-dependent methyltransferase [Thermoactinospora sp.]